MNFFVGLAAFTYTLTKVGPLGWFVLFLAICFVGAFLLLAWPFVLVGTLVCASWFAARWIKKRKHIYR